MTPDIILIGPMNAGKSTIGELLANYFDIPQCSMDDWRWQYYKEIGYDENLAKQKQQLEGFWGVQKYWKSFEAYAVERLLTEHHNCIIDFGAGHSVYDDNHLFQKVKRVLDPYPNVFLLLPSPDQDESVQILNERSELMSDEHLEINEYFVRHSSNYKLAKYTVYSKAKTPEETRNDILKILGVEY
jgi:shikimate kinase